MAGTAKNRDATKITTGPGDLWINMAIPSASARATLHTDGTPDATANPSAKHIGLTRSGNKVTCKWSKQDNEADELTAPYRSILTADDMAIEGELLQYEDFANILQYFAPNGTYSAASGYKQITIGGLTAIASANKPCVALIWTLTNDNTKFGVVMLYQAINDSGLEYTISRKTDAGIPYKLQGQSISSRAAADQIGNVWIQA